MSKIKTFEYTNWIHPEEWCEHRFSVVRVPRSLFIDHEGTVSQSPDFIEGKLMEVLTSQCEDDHEVVYPILAIYNKKEKSMCFMHAFPNGVEMISTVGL